VPGCGNGYEVLTLSAAGFDVTGLDIALTAVNHLRTQIERHDLNAEVLQENILEWQPPQLVDAVYEQTSLCALDPEFWSQYEQQLHSWLKPQGKLFALWMQTNKEDGPPYHCEISEIQSLFANSRWKWSPRLSLVEHPTGIHELAFVLEKRA
jgi:cyclopropane fatty-acyl-phospholipid synthase-like methyltransferase